MDWVELRDLLDFAGIAPPHVPVIPVGQHLAKKLHAYTHDYGSQSNSRPRDLYDMLVIARSLPVPVRAELRAACRATFALRHTAWPPALPAPPTSWAATWDSYVGDHDIPWSDLDAASEALASFWLPLLIGDDDEADDAVWDPAAWAWSAAG